MRAHSLGVIFSPLRMYTETKDSVLVICFFFFFLLCTYRAWQLAGRKLSTLNLCWVHSNNFLGGWFSGYMFAS